MDIEQFRKAGYSAIDRICEHFYSLQEKPVMSQVEPGYLRQALPSEAPRQGESFDIIQEDYDKLIVPGLTYWQHPSFFAYFPTACSFEGILGDLYSSSVSNPGFNWASSPAATELEAITMDWEAKLLGLSSAFWNVSGDGGGVMLTTASDSALTAIVAARSLFTRNYPDTRYEDLILYTTTQTHTLGAKAGLILGILVRSLEVTSDDNFGLRGTTLRQALEEDTAAGKKPFCLIATIGTTSSGAIDRLDEIGPVLRDYPNVWLHVDAAWAGVTMACPEYRDIARLNEVNEFATSFCTNFHKWGLVNFDASTLWVRHRRHLTDALDLTPEYLRTKQGDEATVIDYRNWQLPLGRRFRSLKLWFVLRSFGVEGFQSYIRRCISLNQTFTFLITGSGKFELVTPPSFALSVFRLVPKTAAPLSTESLNDLNRAFHRRISSHPEILLTQTLLNGIFCIRFAVGSMWTDESHIKKAFELIDSEANKTLESWTPVAE